MRGVLPRPRGPGTAQDGKLAAPHGCGAGRHTMAAVAREDKQTAAAARRARARRSVKALVRENSTEKKRAGGRRTGLPG